MAKALDKIQPGEEKAFKVRLEGSRTLATGKAKFRIQIKEHFGFDASPVSLKIPTQEFQPPRPVIADHVFTAPATGELQKGVSINLKLAVQNRGKHKAEDVTVSVKTPENVLAAGKEEFDLGGIKPGQNKKIKYSFFTNNRYEKQEVPIEVEVSESYGKYGQQRTFKATLEEAVQQSASLTVEGKEQEEVEYEDPSLVPEVDRTIPEIGAEKPHTYALVIGNQDYASQQTGLSQESNVPYARNDAQVFARYLASTLGLPANQVELLKDATYAEMKQGINKLKELIKLDDGKARVIFYYAGHGLPDQQTKERYLIPVDVSGNNLSAALPLAEVYNALTAHEAERVSVFIDACFSGAARQEGLVAMRSVKVEPKNQLINGRMAVFTSSSGKQPSLPYDDKKHGLFTYYLLEKLQETKGNVTYGRMANYLRQNVSKEAVPLHDRKQTPQTNVSNQVRKQWQQWQFR